MKRISVALLSLGALSLNALEFSPMGFESISMGGAGVASAKGSMAGYYNPALLAKKRHDAEISLSAGAGYLDNDLVNKIDALANSDITTTITNIANNSPVPGSNTQADRDKLSAALLTLQSINSTDSLTVSPNAAFAAQIGNVAIAGYSATEASFSAVIDKTRLGTIVSDGAGNYSYYDVVNDTYTPTTQADYEANALQYALDNNLTYTNVQGFALIEVPLSYAQAFSTGAGDVALGASLKYMYGESYNTNLSVDTDVNTAMDDAKQNAEKSATAGIDIGMLYTPQLFSSLSLGFVGKNINAPAFNAAGGGKITLDPMYRAGVMYAPFEMLDIAVDYDLTENAATTTPHATRYVGGGLNLHPASWFSLRGGLMQNLADDYAGIVYTAGIGFGLKWFQLDVAAQMSDKTSSVDGDKIPRYGRLNLALVSKW